MAFGMGIQVDDIRRIWGLPVTSFPTGRKLGGTTRKDVSLGEEGDPVLWSRTRARLSPTTRVFSFCSTRRLKCSPEHQSGCQGALSSHFCLTLITLPRGLSVIPTLGITWGCKTQLRTEISSYQTIETGCIF